MQNASHYKHDPQIGSKNPNYLAENAQKSFKSYPKIVLKFSEDGTIFTYISGIFESSHVRLALHDVAIFFQS